MSQNERQNGITEREFSSYENLLHRYILASYRMQIIRTGYYRGSFPYSNS